MASVNFSCSSTSLSRSGLVVFLFCSGWIFVFVNKDEVLWVNFIRVRNFPAASFAGYSKLESFVSE